MAKKKQLIDDVDGMDVFDPNEPHPAAELEAQPLDSDAAPLAAPAVADEIEVVPLPPIASGDRVLVSGELVSPYHWIPNRVLTGEAVIDRIEIEQAILRRLNDRPGEHEWRVDVIAARHFRAAYLNVNPES